MTLGELCIFIALLIVIAKLSKLLTELHRISSIMDTAQLVKLQNMMDETCDESSD